MWELGIKKVETRQSPLYCLEFGCFSPMVYLVLDGKVRVLLSVVVAELKR